jgi:two-component system cell cycle sensor histidine kinase/response regulator CckA
MMDEIEQSGPDQPSQGQGLPRLSVRTVQRGHLLVPCLLVNALQCLFHLRKRKMEAIARLSAGIAHEFNNIAMAIVGYSEVIASQPAKSVGQYANLIKAAGLRAGRLTEQLLSFSRQQLLNPRATDLNQLVSGLEHLLRSMFSEKIRVAVHLDPEPKVAYVDPDLIAQVIQTLLRKAGENVSEGGDVVVGTGGVVVPPEPAQSSSRPGRYCTIAFSDTGPSVDKEVLAHVFDPFFTEGEFGTGDLDLAAAYGIVAQSEGRIDVRSHPGHGNTFIVLLPEMQSSS